MIHFSVVVALTSTMWVAVTQTDKLVLSRILSLSDFGVFALATVVAGGVTSLNAPLSTALLPRLTALSARGDEDQFRSVYKGATQFTAVVCFSAALFLALFAEKVLWAWTGNLKIAENAALTLQLYALGNGLAAFGAFPYYLQYARGNVSLHLIGTLLYLSLLLPGVIVLARYFGTTGAGVAWLSVNTLFLLAWVPVVHYRFLGRFHARWLFFDIAPVALTTAVVGMILKTSVRWPDGRALTVAILMASGAIICASGAAASPAARGLIVGAVRRQFGSRRS